MEALPYHKGVLLKCSYHWIGLIFFPFYIYLVTKKYVYYLKIIYYCSKFIFLLFEALYMTSGFFLTLSEDLLRRTTTKRGRISLRLLHQNLDFKDIYLRLK